MDRLIEAVAAWRDIVGVEGVVTDSMALREAGVATFATTQRIPAIVRARTRTEVAEVLRVASRLGTPVYPISCGKNWGLGSKVPAEDGCALLDLGLMNAITDFDEELAYVTVEPGVTFRHLHRFLSERASKLFASVTGSSPDSSVLANALERGDGSGPYGDRCAHVCAIEAVLATGEIVRTGFSGFGQVPIAPLHRWGVGASLDGLFSQSNLAVVTRITLWLSPLPRSIHALRFSIREDARLPALVDALRSLRLDGTLRATATMWNAPRVRSAGGDVSDGSRWYGLSGLYANTELHGRALREHALDLLAPLVDAWHAEERLGDPRAGRELLWATEAAFGFLQGVPDENSLRSAYALGAPSPRRPVDLDRDRRGLIWACATVPLRGADVAAACALAAQVLASHGFDPLACFTTPAERVAYVLPTIAYERTEASDRDALRCHDALLGAFAARAWLPHRLGIQAMSALPTRTDDSNAVLGRLKAALDPAQVIAPGRYIGQPDVGPRDVGQPDVGQPDVGQPDIGPRDRRRD